MNIKIDRVAISEAAVKRAGGTLNAPAVSLFGCRIEIEPNGAPCDFTEQWSHIRERCRTWSRDHVRGHATARHYYDFYRVLGINPNRTPPSAANLLIRFAIGDGAKRAIPSIQPAVDAGNVAQAENLVPVAVLNAEAVDGDLLLDVAQTGDTLLAFGYEEPQPIDTGRIVLRDQSKVVSEFCYRDGQATAVHADTRRLLILACQVGQVPQNNVESTIHRVVELLAASHHIR